MHQLGGLRPRIDEVNQHRVGCGRLPACGPGWAWLVPYVGCPNICSCERVRIFEVTKTGISQIDRATELERV